MLLNTTIYRDRFAAVGTYPINLLAEMLPDAHGVVETVPNPDTVTIVSGNEAGHFTLSGTSLDFSTAGAAADMPNGVYTLVIRGTWSARAPYHQWDATLTVYCHTRTRYVDLATGADTNDGLTMATPWANPPGSPNASGNSAAYVATDVQRTLISIKGGNVYRGRTNAKANCTYATVGWGIGKAEFTTFVPFAAGVAATSGEVFNNPNVANIKKFAGSVYRTQPIRDGSTLSFPAQYPVWGTDRFIDGQVPTVEGRGMRRLPLNTPSTYIEVVNSKTSRTRYVYPCTWPELVVAFPGINFNGTVCWYWGGANHVISAVVSNHNPATGYFEVDVITAVPESYGVFAVNFSGHPAFINGPGQHAWDATNTYCWLAEGNVPEKASIHDAINIGTSNNTHFYQLRISGGYTDEVQFNGGCILAAASIDITGLTVVACDMGYMFSDGDQAAAVRTAGSGIVRDALCERNTITNFYRSSGFRFSNIEKWNIVVRRNYVDRCGRTSVYLINSHDTLVEDNIFNNCQSAHGNVITFYLGGDKTTGNSSNGSAVITNVAAGAFSQNETTLAWTCIIGVGRTIAVFGAGVAGATLFAKVISFDAVARTITLDTAASSAATAAEVTEALDINAVIRYNTVINCTRPFTTHAVTNMQIYGNVFEMDGDTTAGPQMWSNVYDVLIHRNLFMRRRNDKGNGEFALAIRGRGRAHHNVIDGLSNMAAGEVIQCDNNLVTAITGNDAKIYLNTGTHYANYQSTDYTTAKVWDGTIPTEFKKAVGYGRLGATSLVFALADAKFVDTNDAKTSTLTPSAWTQLVTDSASRPISVSAGLEYSIADNNAGLNATAFTTAPGTVLAGKWIRLQRTASTFNFDTLIGTVNFGDGLTNTWKLTTVRASGLPVVRLTTATQMIQAVAGAAGAASPRGVVFLPAFMGHTAWATTTMIGLNGAVNPLTIETLSTGRLRFRLRNAANNTIAEFSTPTAAIDLDVPHDYLIEWDTTQADATTGLRMYVDGSVVTPSSITWTSAGTVADRNVAWSYAADRWPMGYGANVEFGAILLHNEAPFGGNISDANIRSKFSAVRLGKDDGASIFNGAKPIFLIVGTAATWQSANGTNILNRGSGPQITRQAGTVTAGASSALGWPSFTYASTINVAGPNNPQVGVASEYTVTLDGALSDDAVITFSDGDQGGTFSALTLNWGETPTGTFTYTPVAQGVGPMVITASSTDLASGTKLVNVLPSNATGYTVTIPSTGSVNAPVEIEVSLNGYNPEGVSIDFRVSANGGTFSPSAIMLIPPGESTGDISFIPSKVGTVTIDYDNGEGLIDPSAKLIEISPEVVIIAPGSSVTMTRNQARTLAAITSGLALTTGLGPVELRWRREAANTGEQDGLDITMDVVTPGVTAKTVVAPKTGITTLVASELSATPDDNYVYVELSATSPPVEYE